MTFENFEIEVERLLDERGISFRRTDVIKNNGVVLKGITILGDSNISPNIYLEHVYEHCTREDLTLEESVDYIEELSKIHQIKEGFDVDSILSFERAKNNLILKLINKKDNEQYLSTKPHVCYGDLAIVFQLVVSVDAAGRATVTLENDHVARWNKSTKELFEIAMNNIKDDFVVRNIGEMLMDMGCPIPDCDAFQVPMYVCTTSDGINGAIVMTLMERLKELASRFEKGLYLIPSSIHEIIAIPDDYAGNECLNQMIREVNNDVLSTEERLSDHYYYYDYSQNKLFDSSNKEMYFEM